MPKTLRIAFAAEPGEYRWELPSFAHRYGVAQNEPAPPGLYRIYRRESFMVLFQNREGFTAVADIDHLRIWNHRGLCDAVSEFEDRIGWIR